MPDEPEKLPELIATLGVGSVVSGECSVCHEVVVVRGIGVEAPGELVSMLKQAFADHLRDEHS